MSVYTSAGEPAVLDTSNRFARNWQALRGLPGERGGVGGNYDRRFTNAGNTSVSQRYASKAVAGETPPNRLLKAPLARRGRGVGEWGVKKNATTINS